MKFIKHGKCDTKLYSIWMCMRRRCYDKQVSNYSNYGGRGVTVCDEWLHDFKSFYDWAIDNGYQENLTIDRIDNNNKGYSSDNCRWLTIKEH